MERKYLECLKILSRLYGGEYVYIPKRFMPLSSELQKAKESGLTQKQIAKQFGLSQSTVSRKLNENKD